MSAYASCRSCLAAIVWAVTENRKRMPLNREPDPAGIVLAYCDELGGWHCKPYQPGDPITAPWKRYTSHFATCPKADEHREPKPAAPKNVTQLDDWRKANSAHAKAKRNQRGRRPPPQITGIRIPPP